MIYEWDPRKAKINRRRHGVSFEEAAKVFLDPLAVTYPDPDRSDEGRREVTIGHSARQRVVFVSPTRSGEIAVESSAHGRRHGGSASSMKKISAKRFDDDLRPEYDLSQHRRGPTG